MWIYLHQWQIEIALEMKFEKNFHFSTFRNETFILVHQLSRVGKNSSCEDITLQKSQYINHIVLVFPVHTRPAFK